MNRALSLESNAEPRVRLRSAGPGDLEALRRWKNAAKAGFFFKGEINELMQKAWYASYLERDDDYMFIVEINGKKVGCMGFRMINDAADVYNVIADPEAAGQGYMRAAMTLLCSHIGAQHTKNITCKVLTGNAALAYYVRCGFRVMTDCGDHSILVLDWPAFKPAQATAS